MIEALRKVIQRLHYPLEVMLVCGWTRLFSRRDRRTTAAAHKEPSLPVD